MNFKYLATWLITSIATTRGLCICMKISSVYAREVDMIKMTLNSARESCSLLPSAAEMCGEIFSSGGRGGGGGVIRPRAPVEGKGGGGGGGGGRRQDVI